MVNLLKPDDVCSLVCEGIYYGAFILEVEYPFTTLRNPSERIKMLDPDAEQTPYILFLLNELEMYIELQYSNILYNLLEVTI